VSNIVLSPAASEEIPPSSAPAGTGKYHVLTELGRGGMAVVQAAVARGLGGFAKLVVLKKPRPELGGDSDAFRTFLNEARISARMNHPNVVQVYEVYEEQGVPVIVMEYLDGQSFATLLQSHCSEPENPPTLVLSVLCRALEGLHYAHSLADFDGRPMNLIHRDVTPHNIMVTCDGQVKLLDFGIAKLDNISGETKTGIVKGKLGYMSPEQVEGRALDCRADLFAMGVMIWEVVAKTRMWGEQNEAAVIRRLVLEEIPSLRQLRPDLDPSLLSLCEKATAADRDERHASAAELLNDLRSYLQAHGGVATDSAIAQWVNRACADSKDDAKKRIARKLAQYSQSSVNGQTDFTSIPTRADLERDTASGSRARRKLDIGTAGGYAGETVSRARGVRSGRWAAFVVGGVVLVGALLWGVAAVGPEASTALASPLLFEIQNSREVRPPPAAEVRVRISAEPDTAVLTLDGERLASNPFSAVLARDEREHQLSIRANGFQALERKLHLDTDVELRLSLNRDVATQAEGDSEPEAAPERVRASGLSTTASRVSAALAGKRPPPARPRHLTPSPPPASVAAPAAPQPAPRAAAAACDPPYSLDTSGVKRYKRECFGK
jgi:serine/threonine protein kinase